VLVFSFVGFLQKEQKVGSDSAFNILMTYDNADLDQVVVVGYGTSKRRDLTGAVYSIKPGMVTATPVTNAAEALQGRIPGLDITRNNGAPGGDVNIQLRGNRTLSGTANGTTGSNSAPLVIIDGFQGGSLTDLNPNDIESVEVLKDASSTAIYGWMGANGVIIVTTKRGKDRPKVSYAGYYGVNGYLKYPKSRTGQEFIQFRKDAVIGKTPGATPTDESVLSPDELYYYKQNKWVDYLDLATRNATEQSHTASIQSGGDKTKVFFSTGVYTEQGVLRGTDNTRYNARLNYDQRISNYFKAGFSTQLTYTNTNSRTDPFSRISSFTPLGDPYDLDGNIRLWPGIRPDIYADPKKKEQLNPLSDERPGAYKWNTARGNIIANGYLEVTPLTGLSIRSNFGTTLTYSREGRFFDSVSLQNYTGGLGSTARLTNNFTRFYNWDNIITYTRKFGDHALTLTGLTSYTRSDWDNSDVTGKHISNPGYQYYNLDASTATDRLTSSFLQRTTSFSYAGRLNYTLMGKYLLTATLRSDGVSRLAEGHKYDYFPSVGLGWNIHQEDFMKDFWFVNNLKLRATYGVAGNASVQPYQTQTNLDLRNYIIGSSVVTAIYPNDIAANPNLGWEKSATVNVGLDFALFKSRLYGTIDAYKTATTGILYKRPLPLTSGLGTQWQNIGESENKGIELALSSVNVNQHSFKWTTTVTFTAAQEKLTKLITNKDIINAETNSLLIGHPVTSFYDYHKIGIWQTGENKDGVKTGTSYTYQPGDIKVEDHNNDNVIDKTNDRGYVGSTVPKWFGGLQNTFTYKNFELSVYVMARWGQTINAEFMAGRFNIDGTANGLAGVSYWTPTNPTNDFPQPRSGAQWSNAGYTGYLDQNFIDGSFVKLKTATLAYTLPQQVSRKAFSDRIRLYVTGNNILTKARNKFLKNYDPERGGSENTPLTRQFVFGANVDF
jgi:TonB-linked SusC/RagA family outer membrane protein